MPSTLINDFSSLSLAFYACNYQFSSLRISMPKANFPFISKQWSRCIFAQRMPFNLFSIVQKKLFWAQFLCSSSEVKEALNVIWKLCTHLFRNCTTWRITHWWFNKKWHVKHVEVNICSGSFISWRNRTLNLR